MSDRTSEFYADSGDSPSSCLWFDEPELGLRIGDDPPEDEIDEEDEDSDAPEDFRPEVIDFKASPVCAYSPRVRMLYERNREWCSVLLNMSRGAVDMDFDRWSGLPAHVPLPPRSPVTQVIWRARVLSDDADADAVRADLAAYREDLAPSLGAMTGDETHREFVDAGHHLRDWQLLICLFGLKQEMLFDWWRVELIRLAKLPERLHYLRARDVMRKNDPAEREFARLRDSKRRQTKNRREYLADYKQRDAVLSTDAARKRAARASSTPEQRAAEADRKRRSRAK